MGRGRECLARESPKTKNCSKGKLGGVEPWLHPSRTGQTATIKPSAMLRENILFKQHMTTHRPVGTYQIPLRHSTYSQRRPSRAPSQHILRPSGTNLPTLHTARGGVRGRGAVGKSRAGQASSREAVRIPTLAKVRHATFGSGPSADTRYKNGVCESD